jgi:nucleoside-diphosphate kinase
VDNNNRVVDELTQDVSILIEVKEPSSNMLEEVIGSLEEKNLSIYVYHGNSVANGLFKSTAVLDHCTLCIIKPRLVKEGKVGEILDTILKENYEISALKLVHLTTTEADEFFQVYKGIIRQYHEVVKYLSSSPCIVVEIRGENVVQKFRDLCGPFDVQIAKTLRPHCLRAKYGKNSLFNALHCTDCPEDGVLECQYFFQTLGG